MSPWLLLLAPVILGAVIGLVGWVVRALVTDRIEALAKEIAAVRQESRESAAGQGKRIGDTESEIVAMKAVESERRRVREDTRGVPVIDDGRKGRRDR